MSGVAAGPPRAWHQLAVEEMDNFTFRVESESGNGTYFVDALAYGGKGQCDCKNFQCRIAPIYAGRKPAPKPPGVAACKHQLRVQLYIGSALVRGVLKQRGYRVIEGP